ncbi:MAG: serine hydrolase [Planctomycetota bacterium]
MVTQASVETLATFPLVHAPGERWTYGLSTDVLGVLVEKLSNKSLDRFLYQELFRPLDFCLKTKGVSVYREGVARRNGT